MNDLTVSSGNNQFMISCSDDVGLLIWPSTDADNLHSEVFDSGFCH